MKLISKIAQEVDRRKQMVRQASRDSIYDHLFEEESDEALFSTNPLPKDTSSASPITRPTVRFAETLQCYESKVSLEDYKGCWYTEAQFQVFTMQCEQHSKLIRAMETQSTDPFYWTRSLLRIHKAFGRPSHVSKNSMEILKSNCITIEPRFVGLEFRAVPSIMADYLVRRQALWTEIQYWQQQQQQHEDSSTMLDSHTRATRIAEVCAKASRVSVQYSHYIAQVRGRRTSC